MRLELVRENFASDDTVRALEEILERARSGEYVGFIIGLIKPRRRYTVHCCAEACNNPTFSRGVCRAIDDDLHLLVHANDGPETLF